MRLTRFARAYRVFAKLPKMNWPRVGVDLQKRTRRYGWIVAVPVCIIAGAMFVAAVVVALLLTLSLGARTMFRYLRITAFGLPVHSRKRTPLVSRPRRPADLAATPHRAK